MPSKSRVALRVKRFRFHRSVCVPVADPSCPKVRLENSSYPELYVSSSKITLIEELAQRHLVRFGLLVLIIDYCMHPSSDQNIPEIFYRIGKNTSVPRPTISGRPSFLLLLFRPLLPTLLLLQLVPVFSLGARE